VKTVRLRFDLSAHTAPPVGVPAGGQPNTDQTGWLELSLDAEHTAAAGRASMTGMPLNVEFIELGGALFVKDTSTGRWSKTAMPAGAGLSPLMLFGGSLGGSLPDVPTALMASMADASVKYDLRGVEDCRTGRCYRTAVTIPPEVVLALVGKLTGQAAPPADAATVPVIGLELLTDTGTFRLVDGIASGSANGTSATLRVQLANHDEPIPIQAPNPALVDDRSDGSLGGGSGAGVVGPGASGCVTTGNTTTCTITAPPASTSP
jgi:hypothetical protein